MSNYKPRHGDRVRVTQSFEGEVVVNEHYFEVEVDGARHSFDWDEVGESSPFAHHFEKIAEPLPTTPGSVIRDTTSHSEYVLTGGGMRRLVWRGVYSFDEYDGLPAWSRQFDVIFDAGKAS